MREEGFYWVQQDGHNAEVAWWVNGAWRIAGEEYTLQDADLKTINEARLRPWDKELGS